MKKAIKAFKYFLFFIGVSLILSFITSSCITEKKRAQICATCPVITKDSIQVQTEPFDTTLFITKYGEDISLRYANSYNEFNKELIDLFKKYNDTIQTYKNGIKTTIIKTPKNIVFRCKADSLEYQLKLERMKKTTVRTVVKSIPVPCPDCPKCTKVHRTGFDSFLRWFFWIIVILIAIRNLPTFIKALITNIKNFR